MECPECGYALSPLDKNCPRCRLKKSTATLPPAISTPSPPNAYASSASSPVSQTAANDTNDIGNVTVFGMLALLVGFGFGISDLACNIPHSNALFSSRGRDAVGTVVLIHPISNFRDRTGSAIFTFTAENGKTYRVKNKYPLDDWNKMNAGQSVHVRYLADNPDVAEDVNSIAGKPVNARRSLIFSLSSIVIGIALFIIGRRMDKRSIAMRKLLEYPLPPEQKAK